MTLAQRTLAPGYAVSPVIRGGWQLAGGHGAVEGERAVDDLLAAFDAGITAFDCADIYTGVEALLGRFRRRLEAERGAAALARVRVHTKLVPDLARLPRLAFADVEAIVARSARRLGTDRLDLVQFHWWDLGVPRHLEVLGWLDRLRRDGRVAALGGTNFDTAATAAILDAGIPLLTTQVQYSLIDARPAGALAALARERGLHLLCYGTVAGGFLAERWLGAPEPAPPFENRSLTKYKLVIDDWGGWDLFQRLLRTLRDIARRHGADIATVASRWALDQPAVAAVIVGARDRAHLAANVAVGRLRLDDADSAALAAVLARRRGPAGDVYALERDRDGRHGSIMRYDLNALPSP